MRLNLSQLPPEQQSKTPEEIKEQERKKRLAIDTLWRKAVLNWKLDSNQKEMYKFATETTHQIVVIGSSRQLGKSYFLTVLAIETCLKTPNVIVKFIAPKTKDIKRIIAPIVKEVTADCPKDLRPQYKMHDNTYLFHNGSEIQLAGTDNGHAESIRGNKAHICIIDEAGFCDDLRYIVNSILIPTTTMTGGKIIMSSTPSRSPDHDFMSFMEEAELEGRFIKKTIYDNPRLTTEQIDRIAEGLGGKQTTDFRREYLVEKITSEDDAVVPEFTKALQEKIVQETPIAPFYDAYVAMDIGVKDLTVVLFAYYDFMTSKIIVQDELVMQGSKMLTDDLAAQIKLKEDRLWTSSLTGEKREPFLRVADNNNLVLLNDLSTKHRLNFRPTEKDNSVAMINNMRMLIRQEQVIIDPKCKTLISHLENAIWNKARDSYARSSDKGHYDAVDALKYLCRNMSMHFSKNPYPADYKYNFKADAVIYRKEVNNQPTTEVEKHLAKVFTVKRRGFGRY